jgi:hypothetical protein
MMIFLQRTESYYPCFYVYRFLVTHITLFFDLVSTLNMGHQQTLMQEHE